MTTDSDPPPRPALSEQPITQPPADRPLAAIGLLAVLGLFNFLYLPLLRGGQAAEGAWLLAASGVGVFAAELGLATLWLVWGSGPFGLRLAMHWAAALGLCCCWALGLIASFQEDFLAREVPGMIGATALGLPMVSLAAQIPLWPLRTHLGWRIERPSAVGNPYRASQPLSIRDMIWATVVTCVSLGCLRLVTMLPYMADPQFWPVWGIALSIIVAVSALTLLPSTIFAFRMGATPAAALAMGGYAMIAWIITGIIISMIGAAMGDAAPAEVYIAIFACYGSFALTLGLPLLFAASRGYRLTFASERRRADV